MTVVVQVALIAALVAFHIALYRAERRNRNQPTNNRNQGQ